MDVLARRRVERIIARAVINSGLATGYTISVHNGNEVVLVQSTDCQAIIAEMFSVDEERLLFFKDGNLFGAVYFVYGNDGWDAVCDYTSNLQHIMKDADQLSDKYSSK